ncbi:MarR family transcriptional regulator [Pseudoflavitalea sp. X16]|uniref:MarR family winged helix-turn-helix transcriptional regulator n=1 Tax=Paraflavitalea devenefica TaxID=2716334 RepID=UPI00142270BE|nr:MarR family transcriptional regulator [Paraflavitalea devenefica]NII29199.1 MarR family transcriptional regulator [Paraflavitalea devenefica]
MSNNRERPAPPLMISLVGSLYGKMRRECDNIFREKEFPLEMDQIPVLMLLYYQEGASQQEISQKLQRDKASVNRTVSFLLKKDIVTVIQDTADKRKTRVELTATGKKLARQANTALEKFDTAFSSALTEEERKHFQDIMLKLIGKPAT